MITQLTDPIPVTTPLGYARAIFLDTGDWDVVWGCAQRATGEFWWWQNKYIRMDSSITGEHVDVTEIMLPPCVAKALEPHLRRHGK